MRDQFDHKANPYLARASRGNALGCCCPPLSLYIHTQHAMVHYSLLGAIVSPRQWKRVNITMLSARLKCRNVEWLEKV